MTPALIEQLDPTAFVIEPAADCKSETILSWLREAFRSSQTDAGWALLGLTGLVTACAALLWVAASDGSPIRTLGVFFGLAVAGGVYFFVYGRAVARLSARVDSQITGSLGALVSRIDANATTHLSWARCYESCAALLRITEISKAAFGKPAISIVTAAGTFAAFSILVPPSTFALALGGWMGLIALECLGGVFAVWSERELSLLGLAARRRLATILWGMSRLITLNATSSAILRWTRDDDQSVCVRRRLMPVGDMLASTRLVYCVVYAAGFALTDPPQTQSRTMLAMALFWLAAASAKDSGVYLAQLIRAWRRWAITPGILRLPRDKGVGPVKTCADPIEVRDVSYSYPGSGPALKRVSLTVNPTLCTAICGPSGSGKSTLVQLILGLKEPEAGAILVGGVSIAQIDQSRWRDRIAGVFQSIDLDPAATVRASISGYEDVDLDTIWDVLEVVDLVDDIGGMPMGLQTIVEQQTISGSQRQRLLIARALATKPALLVLDEATNAIEDTLLGRLMNKLRERGVGCIMITHRPELMAMADQCFEIQGGEFVRTWNPKESIAFKQAAT